MKNFQVQYVMDGRPQVQSVIAENRAMAIAGFVVMAPTAKQMTVLEETYGLFGIPEISRLEVGLSDVRLALGNATHPRDITVLTAVRETLETRLAAMYESLGYVQIHDEVEMTLEEIFNALN